MFARYTVGICKYIKRIVYEKRINKNISTITVLPPSKKTFTIRKKNIKLIENTSNLTSEFFKKVVSNLFTIGVATYFKICA